MSDNKISTAPPAYSDSLTENTFPASLFSSISQSQQLADRLTTTRSQHLISVLHQHVLPVIQERASRGLSRTVIALFPKGTFPLPESEFLSEYDNEPVDKGRFLDEDDVEFNKTTWLSEDIDTAAFWSEDGLIADLERTLKEILSPPPPPPASAEPPQSVTKEVAPHPVPEPQNMPPSSPVTEPSQRSRGWFRRRAPQTLYVAPVAPQAEPTPPPPPLPPPERVIVKVRAEDVRLKRINGFGLSENITKRSIPVVRIQIRT